MKSKCLLSVLIVAAICGCAVPIPKDIFQAPANIVEQRTIQSRKYETTNETEILSACAGVLQDLGYKLDNSETKLGLIVGSKDEDATDASQIATAILVDVIITGMGGYSNTLGAVDNKQKIQLSIITKPSFDNKIHVRVTFQRIVWNRNGYISRYETINDPLIYQQFYDRLSKSVFLEAQNI